MAQIGSQIAWSVLFKNAAGADADPGVVKFYLREEVDGAELTWTYSASPIAGTHYPVGMSPLVKDSVGDYSIGWVARKSERHTGVWAGSGGLNQSPSPTTVLVRHSPIAAIDNP